MRARRGISRMEYVDKHNQHASLDAMHVCISQASHAHNTHTRIRPYGYHMHDMMNEAPLIMEIVRSFFRECWLRCKMLKLQLGTTATTTTTLASSNQQASKPRCYLEKEKKVDLIMQTFTFLISCVGRASLKYKNAW